MLLAHTDTTNKAKIIKPCRVALPNGAIFYCKLETDESGVGCYFCEDCALPDECYILADYYRSQLEKAANQASLDSNS